jgi:hypothetical protein
MMLAAIDATPNSMIKPHFGSREFNCIIVREAGLIDVPNWDMGSLIVSVWRGPLRPNRD